MPPIDLPNLTDTAKVFTMMRDALISHDTRLQDIRNDLNDSKKDIDTLKEVVLIGNPTTGLLSHVEIIRNLETYINGLKENNKYWGRLIGGALVLNFLGFMTGVVIAVVRFLPLLEKLAK